MGYFVKRIEKKCLCGNLFYVTEKNLEQRPCKFCSVECKNKYTCFKKGDYSPKKGKTFVQKIELSCICGKKFYKYESSIKKYINSFCSLKCKNMHREIINPNLRYDNLHNWVRRKKGKPTICEHCNKTDGRIEWANKSHLYKKKIEDWISLCKKCHYQYDKDIVSASVIFNIHTKKNNLTRIIKIN
jgi:hypothetical protein